MVSSIQKVTVEVESLESKEIVKNLPSSSGGEAEVAKDLSKVLNGEKLKEIVESMNRLLRSMDIQMRFYIYPLTKDVIIRLIDIKKQQIVREIPSLKILEMLYQMLELAGISIDKKV